MSHSAIINFVTIKTVWVPAREEDYNKLYQLGIPMTWVGADQQSILEQLAARKGFGLTYTRFAEVEKALIERIRNQWQHEFVTSNKDMIFTLPTDSDPKHWEGLLSALVPWYARYHIRIEQQTRTRRRGTVLVHTLSRHFADYLTF